MIDDIMVLVSYFSFCQIYDATNSTVERRQMIMDSLKSDNIQVSRSLINYCLKFLQ